jgi:hypothetical protein
MIITPWNYIVYGYAFQKFVPFGTSIESIGIVLLFYENLMETKWFNCCKPRLHDCESCRHENYYGHAECKRIEKKKWGTE